MLLSGSRWRVVFSTFFLLASFKAHSFELVLGKVSTDSEKAEKELAPMVQFFSESLSEYGVSSGTVRLFDAPDDLIDSFKQGHVHWVTDTGLMASRLIHKAEAEAVAIKWKKGNGRYRSIIFTRDDSAIRTLKHLVGKTIVFEDEGSFSSYYLPRYLIEKQGINMHFLSSLREERNPDAINYLFGRTEKNIALWVDKGLVEAGALSSNDWNSVRRLLPESKRKMRKLAVSKEFPRAFELISPVLSPALRGEIKEGLMRLNLKDHKSLLKSYEKTTQFESVTDEYLEQLRAFYQTSKTW